MKKLLSTENVIYFALLFTFLLFVISAFFGYVQVSLSTIIFLVVTFLVAFGGLYQLTMQIEKESEKAREIQARKILKIAQSTLPYLRQGLDMSSAKKVTEILLKETGTIAVAITDRRRVLAFSGKGRNHHYPGQKISTKATKEALKKKSMQIVTKKDEIGCPEPNCNLKAAIIIPLKKSEKLTATLKFYYGREGKIAPAEIATAEGIGHLLETQLELSQVSRLETLACEAELKALQSQINPHFFFNVLNTAVSHCRHNPAKARRILLDFSNFFRTTIEHGEEPLITLDLELAYLTNYLELERDRFDNRLEWNVLVSDRARTWRLPPFTLQPIVENAINHAFPSNRPLIINIKDFSTEDLRIIEINDNGKGIPKDKLSTVLLKGKGQGLGVGLSLIHERIKLLYGEEYGLTVDSVENVGTTVRVIMPSKSRFQIA